MKRAVRVLRRAQLDLLEIQAYVLHDDPTAAGRLIDALVAELARLGRFPSRGAHPRDERLRSAGYRYVVHGEYRSSTGTAVFGLLALLAWFGSRRLLR